MATPAKRKPYNIIYSDGTYQTFDLTAKDFEVLINCMVKSYVAVLSNETVLVTKDIRTVVQHVETPEPPKPEFTVPEELDDASKEWLRENIAPLYYGEGREFVDE